MPKELRTQADRPTSNFICDSYQRNYKPRQVHQRQTSSVTHTKGTISPDIIYRVSARGFLGTSAYNLLSKLSINDQRRIIALKAFDETAENSSRWIWGRKNKQLFHKKLVFSVYREHPWHNHKSFWKSRHSSKTKRLSVQNPRHWGSKEKCSRGVMTCVRPGPLSVGPHWRRRDLSWLTWGTDVAVTVRYPPTS
ncbi:reverse transcriptase [Plakobranchus ocellatus]|uniref:Reverse transcriptase n=1 Tax=Plakobranchus ocellatus TaxID=259542 RepID=A0AAV3ZXE8_9GAST|nr:reverse transcriptase [Plakobranchus ocellatus]